MATQVTNYICPACGGPLHFDSDTGKLKCDYCDSVYDVSYVEQYYAQKDESAGEAKHEADQKEEAEGTSYAGYFTDEVTEDGFRVKVYSCPSCGAQLICDENTAATSCPYCGNNTVVPGNLDGALKPDYIIPFKYDKEAAKEGLKKHYKGKRLLPKAFSDKNHIDKIQGVYVPFWLYSGTLHADLSFKATRSVSHREGQYMVTDTSHFDVGRSGNVTFSNIPADASYKMPDDYMDSLEPFNFSEMVPFSNAYLPGYLADKYSVSAEDCDERARSRAVNTTRSEIGSTASVGYETCVPDGESFDILSRDVKYAFVPVWTLATKYQGKDYLFVMNGQTGKMVGNLPVSWGRFWGYFAAIAGCLSLIATAILYFA